MVDEALAWARGEARFHSEAQRAEVVALFERARRVYASGPGD